MVEPPLRLCRLGRVALVQVVRSSMEIRSSALLTRMMQMVLLIGNKMNQGTMRGAANGFKIGGLIKLAGIKASNGTTLLHYLCKVLLDKMPEVRAQRFGRSWVHPQGGARLDQRTRIQLGASRGCGE